MIITSLTRLYSIFFFSWIVTSCHDILKTHACYSQETLQAQYCDRNIKTLNMTSATS
eukprot:c38114_g1_i1 orf=67-237(+)